MDLRGKKIVVIGGAGVIGSHTVDALTREDAAEILEACLAGGVERLVYSSLSASVYGDAVEEPMTEDHPFNRRKAHP